MRNQLYAAVIGDIFYDFFLSNLFNILVFTKGF